MDARQRRDLSLGQKLESYDALTLIDKVEDLAIVHVCSNTVITHAIAPIIVVIDLAIKRDEIWRDSMLDSPLFLGPCTIVGSKPTVHPIVGGAFAEADAGAFPGVA